jgi:polysaccharide biosynthesis protein PslH
MRILLLTQVLPYPPDSGPRIKTYNMVQHLAQRHEVTLVSLVRTEKEAADAERLRGLCADVHTVPLRRSRARDVYHLARSFVADLPFIIARDHSAELHQLLRNLTARTQFDAIHVDQLNMVQFAFGLPVPRIVLDQHNAVWTIPQRMADHLRLGPKRLFLEIEARRLRRYEAEVCARVDAVLAVSEQDRWALNLAAEEHGVGQAREMAIVPIAIDTHTERAIPREPNPRRILSLATMFWPPNVEGVMWFAHEVYPLVQAQVPDVQFSIVGARPPHHVRQLAEADPSIEVTGYVDDPRPYIASSAALIVPVHAGGGMRVKILEALARGIPIVSTTIGYEGIDLVPGEHLLVGDTPEQFAAALVRLLQSPAQGAALAAAGRQLVEQQYEWRVVYRAVDRLYERLCSVESDSRAAASRQMDTHHDTPLYDRA